MADQVTMTLGMDELVKLATQTDGSADFEFLAKLSIEQRRAVEMAASKGTAKKLYEESTRAFHGFAKAGSVPKIIEMSEGSELADQPMDWFVKNLFEEEAKIVIGAEQKAGKSFIISSLAVAIASGIPFLDTVKFSVVKPSPVMILAGEDSPKESMRRIKRVCKSYGILMSTLPISWLDAHNVRLDNPAQMTWLLKNLQKRKARLLIIDPVCRMMNGDENNKNAWDQVLEPLSIFAAEHGISICLVHHLGKESAENPRSGVNRLRGSSNLASWFTTAMLISGSVKNGKVDCELSQRVGGMVQPNFRIDVLEEPWDEQTGVKGAFRLKAHFPEKGEDLKLKRTRQAVERIEDVKQDILIAMGEHAGVPMLAEKISLLLENKPSQKEFRTALFELKESGTVLVLTAKDDKTELFMVERGVQPAVALAPAPVPGNGALNGQQSLACVVREDDLSEVPF